MGHRSGTAEDTGSVRDELVEFLRSAPPRLQAWADAELSALQVEPEAGADGDPDSTTTPPPAGGGGIGPEARVRGGLEAADAGERDGDEIGDGDGDEIGDGDEDEDSGPVPRQPQARDRSRPGRWLRSRTTVVLLALAAVAAAVVGVYDSGRPAVPGITGTATDTASADPSIAPPDPAKVSALMAKISADPKDVVSLAALGDLYFAAGDYKTSAGWQQKVIAVDPKNVTARLALGACQFNQGDARSAEQQWLRVVALDPQQAEAHYDLGFLYLSQDPPDLARVRQEWNRVVQIDPNSQIAKTVATHLQSLQTTSPSPAASGGR